ncbi:hypothetical protein C3E90_03450 [Clostridium sp. Cult2]|nr:hypothetical protein [Clostridium sp. Cult2]
MDIEYEVIIENIKSKKYDRQREDIMKRKTLISKTIFIAIVMVMTVSAVSFADEPTKTIINLISEDSGYKILVSNFFDLKEVTIENELVSDTVVAAIMKIPEKNSDGTYTIFEVVTTDEDAYWLDSYPGIIGGNLMGHVYGEFKDGKFSYDIHIDSIEDLIGQVLLCNFGVMDEEGNYTFEVIDLYYAFLDEEEYENLPSAWAFDEIEKAKEYNLVTEKVLNNYKQNITREELCELTVKLYEALSGEEAIVPDTNKFTDTDNIEILKANKLGIINGVSETLFSPDANVTREQIASMIYRTLKAVDSSLVEHKNTEIKFVDKDKISNYALEAIGFMSDHGIIGGVGDNKVAPQGNATREQAIVLIERTFEEFK